MSFTPPFSWQPGEHLAVLGQTGSGKSTFVSQLLSVRRFVLIVKTKPDNVKYQVDVKAKRAKAMDMKVHERILLSPRYREQQEEVALALERVWKQGGWTVYIDELFYISDFLKLEPFVERLLTQGRSKGISVVCGMQRPSRISRFAISESTHVVAFFLEGRDRKIVKEAGSEILADAVEGLERYQFAWLYRPTREVWSGRVQDLTGRQVAV